MGDRSRVNEDAVVKNTVKSQEQKNGASTTFSWGKIIIIPVIIILPYRTTRR